MLKRTAHRLLHLLQTQKPYRVLMRRAINRNVQYRIATAEDASGISGLYGRNRSPGYERPEEMHHREYDSMDGLRYMLVAVRNERLVGTTVIRRFPDYATLYPDWWLLGMQVQHRYRGAGIGEEMARMALAKASAAGADRVNLMVDENNTAAIGLYRKMGFRKTFIPGLDEKIEKEAQEGKGRRMIMSRPVEKPSTRLSDIDSNEP